MSTTDYNKIITTVNSITPDYTFIPDSNNVIVIDTSNNRIGINTVNPEASIHVSGGTIITDNLIVNNLDGDSSFNSNVDISNRLVVNGDASFNSNVDISNIKLTGIANAATQKGLYYDNTTGQVTYANSGSTEIFYCAKSADTLVNFNHNNWGPHNNITGLDNNNSFRISSGGNNIFDQSTGIFTCQVAGVYEISCKMCIFGWKEEVHLHGYTRANSSASWDVAAIQEEYGRSDPNPESSYLRNTETLTFCREFAVGNQVKFNFSIRTIDSQSKQLRGHNTIDYTAIRGHKMS